jgi:hypothetical protein
MVLFAFDHAVDICGRNAPGKEKAPTLTVKGPFPRSRLQMRFPRGRHFNNNAQPWAKFQAIHGSEKRARRHRQSPARGRYPGAASSPARHALAVPILLRFAPHGGRPRVLDLEPMVDAAGPIRRAEAFRHDALTAELAGMMENKRAFRHRKLVKRDAGMLVVNRLLEPTLAIFNRLPAQVFTIELDTVERTERRARPVTMLRTKLKTARPVAPPMIASPSMTPADVVCASQSPAAWRC